MRFSDTLRTALDNLRRRKVRSFLTIFGVFVGILTVVTMTSLGVGVQAELERNIRAIGLETIFVSPDVVEQEGADPFAPPQVSRPLTPALVEELRALPGVAAVAPTIELPFGMGIELRVGEQEAPLRLVTRDPFEPFETDPATLVGRVLEPGDAGGITLSANVAAQLGQEPAALVGQAGTLIVTTPRGDQTEVPTEIVGVVEMEGNQAFVANAERQSIKGWWYNRPNFLEEEGYDGLVVQAESIENVAGVIAALEARDLDTQSLQEVLTLASRIFAVLQTLLASVGTLALFVASLGVVNTMLMAIYERTREIGVLKATGAAPGDIRRLFMAEAAMMGLLGGLAGVVFGALLGKGIDWIAHRYLASEQVTGIGALSIVPPWLALGALAFGTLVGVLAGLYPAARAASLDPVQALRYD